MGGDAAAPCLSDSERQYKQDTNVGKGNPCSIDSGVVTYDAMTSRNPPPGRVGGIE